jgi:hypothetical protein
LNFNLQGDRLPPVDPDECVSLVPDLAAAVLLFDIWVVNGDRHVANLALDTSATPVVLSVFDRSHALLGRQANGAATRLVRLRDDLGIAEGTDPTGNRHCLLDAIHTDAHFPKWLDRIAKFPDYVIDDTCRLAVGTGATQDEAWAAVQFLKYRRDQLRSIITTHRDRFTVPTWSCL